MIKEIKPSGISLFITTLLFVYSLVHVWWSEYFFLMIDSSFVTLSHDPILNARLEMGQKAAGILMIALGFFIWVKPRLLFPIYLMAFFYYSAPIMNQLNFHDQHIVYLQCLTCFAYFYFHRNKELAFPLRQYTIIYLGMFYFAAGVAKYYYGAPNWHNGTSVQYRLIEYYANADGHLGLWIANQFWLCEIFSILTLLFEIGFPLCLFFRRLQTLMVATSVFFITSVLIIMKIDFFSFLMPAYLVFLPWDRIEQWLFKTFPRAHRQLDKWKKTENGQISNDLAHPLA